RAMQDREDLPALVALVGADTGRDAIQLTNLFTVAAPWATHAIRPEHPLEVAMCADLVRKHRQRFAKTSICFRFHGLLPFFQDASPAERERKLRVAQPSFAFAG